jgi:hypothetical protein
MTEKELDRILGNDKEWRKYLLMKMEAIEKEQREMIITLTTLKVKLGFISAVFGLLGGYITKKLGV